MEPAPTPPRCGTARGEASCASGLSALDAVFVPSAQHRRLRDSVNGLAVSGTRLLLAVIFLVALPAIGHAMPTPEGGACVADAECAVGTVCDHGFCTKSHNTGKIIPPFYFHKTGPSGYRDIVPLLWFHNWNRDSDTKVQFPFFFHSENKPAHSAWTFVLPLFWTQREGSSSLLVVPLLLAGGSRDEKTGETWRVMFPVFFDHQTRDTRWTLAPLAWFSRSPGHSMSVIFPFFWQAKSPGHSTSVIFPLYWRIKDQPLGYDHLLLLPFVDYQSDAHGRHTRIASFLGGWERDDDAGLKQGLLLVPPIFYRKDPQRIALVLPPLAAWWKVRADGSTGFVAGPFFHSTDPEGSTSGFFPLFWRWHDNKTGATTHWLFPIAGFHKRPDAAGGYVGPVYGWKSSKGWGGGVAPLIFFGRNQEKHHALVLPLFARFSDDKAGTSTTAVVPVFYHHAADGWDAGLFPLLFAGRHNDKTYGAVPPIYWHFGQKDGATDVVGPLYVQHGKDGWRGGLAPLFFFGNKGGHEHEVIAPLFFRFVDHNLDTERTLVGPFYHQRDGKQTLDVLFPLMYLARAPGHGLLVTPFAAWKKDANQETLIVGPYLQQTDKQKQSKTRFLFPFGAIHDAPGYHLVVQFPFFWRVREGDETDTVVFPFYWRIRSPRMQLDGVFPLFVHAKNEVATTTVIGPLWNRTRKDGGRALGLFPLFAYGSNNKDGKPARWFGMPGIFYRDNQRTLSGELIVGPFYDIKRAGGYDAGLPPILFAWRRGTVSHVITPIFYRERDTAADTSFNFLGPFYWGNTGPEKRFGVFPLLFVKQRPDGASVGIFPLLYINKKAHGSVGVTPLFGWSKYETGWRMYFGPFYARRDNEISSTAFWPLAYFMRNKTTGSTLKMVLPLYFDGRDRTGRELQVMTPLIWRYRSVERTITVGVPFYFDVHSFGESRTTGFLPFFLRNKSSIDKTVSYTVPALLLWARHRETGPDPGNDFVWFPLVWRYGGKDSTTIVAPLFFDFKRGESRTTLGLPVFAYWKRNDTKRLIVFNMYYRRGVGQEEGSWHCYVVPFADFGRPRKQDLEWNVLMGLFGYSRQGRERKLKLFWLWEVPLQDVPASNLAWFGSTPTSARTEF
jgi:hypothetical protein